MARKNIVSAFDALAPDTDALDPNWFSSPIVLNNASPTPPTEVQLPKAAAERLPDVALHNLPGFITVPPVESAPTAAASTPPTQIAVESALTTSASLLAGDPTDADPTDCPRSITFTIPGAPGVTIHAEEGEGMFEGDLVFTATVNNTATLEGDLGGLFFQFNESKLSGLTVTGSDVPLTFQTDPTGGDKIIDLGQGVNMRGAVTMGFDLGILFGTTSDQQDITTATFVISDPGVVLKLEDLHDPGETSQVGARVIAIGSPSGPRHTSEKLTAFAPYPPTAVDDFYTTNEDDAITVDVTSNDQDANGSPLTVDHIVSQPQYGSVTINADGTLTYTPFLDAVIDGTPINTDKDTFQYCVHDALGGEDHATVTVTVIPVAEAPSISLSVVGVGASASDTLIRVTAISEDFGTRTQGSDFIQSLQLSLTGNFFGVTFSDDQGLLDPSTNIITTFGQPGTFTDVIHVNTAALNGLNFNLDDVLTITAVAAETELPTATASASKSQPIQIDYSTAAASVDFTTQDQNIWGPGNAFTFDYQKFLGISDGSDGFQDGTVSGLKKFGGTIGGTTHVPYVSAHFGATVHGTVSLKAGFQVDLNINGGSFTASLPFNITLNDVYNKTTDTLQVNGTDSALPGTLDTIGPGGTFDLKLIFQALASVGGQICAGVCVGSHTTIPQFGKTATLLSVDSADTHATIPLGPFTVSLTYPQVNTHGTGTTSISSSKMAQGLGVSIDVVEAILDAFIGSDPLKGDLDGFGSYDLLSANLKAGLNLQQQFDLTNTGLSAQLLVGTSQTPETLNLNGTSPPIQNVSSLGLNPDGTIPLALQLTLTGAGAGNTPELQNITNAVPTAGASLTVGKVSLFGTSGTLFKTSTTVPLGSFNIFQNTFPAAFQPQTVTGINVA